ncbi:hypothetical protein ACFFX0_29710 [Citricoccus parietis]|uniref:Uncharacterized protein n=1 Tax=Citricoccus parietis TaxID=592307 RepID=A0ABV5G8B4_9MICC
MAVTMDLGYGAAGLAVAAMTLGMAWARRGAAGWWTGSDCAGPWFPPVCHAGGGVDRRALPAVPLVIVRCLPRRTVRPCPSSPWCVSPSACSPTVRGARLRSRWTRSSPRPSSWSAPRWVPWSPPAGRVPGGWRSSAVRRGRRTLPDVVQPAHALLPARDLPGPARAPSENTPPRRTCGGRWTDPCRGLRRTWTSRPPNWPPAHCR